LNAIANEKAAAVIKVRPGSKKTCVGCRVKRPVTDFGANKRKPDGKNDYCRICRVELNGKRKEKVATKLAGNPELPEEKECYRCEKMLPLENFALSLLRSDGRHQECKKCALERVEKRTEERVKARNSKDFVAPLRKVCLACRTEKAASDFGIDVKTKDGLFNWCTQCRRATTPSPMAPVAEEAVS
jgi:hypothetical protein